MCRSQAPLLIRAIAQLAACRPPAACQTRLQSATGARLWQSRATAAPSTAVTKCCWQRRNGSSPLPLSIAASVDSNGSTSSRSSLETEVCSIKCCLLDVPGGLAEEVAEVLLAYGAQSVAVEEYRHDGSAEQELFANDSKRVWDRCTVVAYFPPEARLEGGTTILASTAVDFGLEGQRQVVEAVRTQDWEQSIKDSYKPAQVAEELWIVPIWSQVPDPAATNIVLEPGLAFGTGDHPTTRLCLRWLQRLQQGGSLIGAAVMDYGAGSGVLAVAALVMGAERAVGTDIDPLAVKSTLANAALNGVAKRLAAHQCAVNLEQREPLEAAGVAQERRQFDVTVANILQGPLVGLAPRLAAYTKPGGLLGLSGILQEQVEAVVAAYCPWFHDFQVEGEERWALVTAVRRAGA